MARIPELTRREQSLVFDVAAGLASATDFAEMHAATEKALAELCGAQHVALCLIQPEGEGVGFEWKTHTLGRLLKDYGQWAQDDFVGRAVMRHPNQVLSDAEMLSGQKLEQTKTYQRSQQSGILLRHTVAVYVEPRGSLAQGGITLYREQSKPFSAKSRYVLQRFVPALAGSFQSIIRFSSLAFKNLILEEISAQPAASLVLNARGKEVLRTRAVTAILERWFPRSSRSPAGIPREWETQLATLIKGGGRGDPEQFLWRKVSPEQSLEAVFTPLPISQGGPLWELRIRERPNQAVLKESWRRRLTARQAEVASCLLQGSEDKEIAQALRCAPGTVKKHLQAIYDKLDVEGRADFISKALRD
ncbi:regulatory protein, luxR family [Stigmatella aurantiaca]|uniref:Regulatory protein, luxR family n=1 Tax=Stigmatella aurantiaca TaxID=41 RepID=A0A1H7Y1B1_STIAU|nr:LuxR C-terminal-related transcriptional regulator [Stigmatella aurantiaca]SEM39986.1 regulatory protein, luxR family [Stigmatella aurantiaca]